MFLPKTTFTKTATANQWCSASDRIIGCSATDGGKCAQVIHQIIYEGGVSLQIVTSTEMAGQTKSALGEVNVTFANELSLASNRYGIVLWELIERATTHPHASTLQIHAEVDG